MKVIDGLEYEVIESLLPCADCNSGDLGVFKDEGKEQWFVSCISCGQKGQEGWNRSLAIQEWNKKNRGEE